jgi:hypothetical protein
MMAKIASAEVNLLGDKQTLEKEEKQQRKAECKEQKQAHKDRCWLECGEGCTIKPELRMDNCKCQG